MNHRLKFMVDPEFLIDITSIWKYYISFWTSKKMLLFCLDYVTRRVTGMLPFPLEHQWIPLRRNGIQPFHVKNHYLVQSISKM